MIAQGRNSRELRCVLEESTFNLILFGPGENRTLHHNPTLGSGDLTESLAGFFADVFEGLHGVDLRASPGSWTRLWRAAEAARAALLNTRTVTIHEEALATIDGTPRSLELDLTREKAETLLRPNIERFLATMDGFVTEENVTPAPITLAADAATLPQLAAAILERFHQAPEVESLTPAPEARPPAQAPDAKEPLAATHPMVEMARALLPDFHPDDQAEVKAALNALINAPTEEDTLKAFEDLLFFIHGPPEDPRA